MLGLGEEQPALDDGAQAARRGRQKRAQYDAHDGVDRQRRETAAPMSRQGRITSV